MESILNLPLLEYNEFLAPILHCRFSLLQHLEVEQRPCGPALTDLNLEVLAGCRKLASLRLVNCDLGE